MNRRTFLLGCGAVGAGVGAAVGSGAFSRVYADRAVQVDVVSDDDAYLRLTATDPNYAADDGGQLSLAIDDEFEEYRDADPEEVNDGVNADATTYLDDVFEVENQGTRPVAVYSTHDPPAGAPSLSIYDSSDSAREPLSPADPSDPIAVGRTLSAGVRIDSHGVRIDDSPYELTLTIGATTG